MHPCLWVVGPLLTNLKFTIPTEPAQGQAPRASPDHPWMGGHQSGPKLRSTAIVGWDLGNEQWVLGGPSPSLSPLPLFLDLLDLLDHPLCLPVCELPPSSSPAALYTLSSCLSVALQGLAYEFHSQRKHSNRAGVGGLRHLSPLTWSVMHFPESHLSLIPHLPGGLLSPSWGRQSPRVLLALPPDTDLQNAQLPRSPGFW